MSNFPTEKLDLAKNWLQAAGAFLRENLSEMPEISVKTSHDDLVTDFDRAVQTQLENEIFSHFPNDKILAEELGRSYVDFDLSNSDFWVIDPIDGTSNFVAQKDHFAVMLAYYEQGVGQFGLILDVMQERLYWNDADFSYCNERKLTAQPQTLPLSLLMVNSYMYLKNEHNLQELAKKSLGVRNYGSAGISYAAMLEGQFLGYFSNLSPWDFAAGAILLSKIGVATLTLDGEPVSLEGGRQKIFSASREVLPEILALLKAK